MPKWMKVLLSGAGALAAVYALTFIPRSGRPRLPAAPDNPVKLRVEGPRSRVTLEKKGGDWRVIDPVDWPADRGAVTRLLDGLGSLAPEAEVTARAESHSQYELDERAVRVQAWAEGASEPFEVRLGKTAGFTDRAYARFAGPPVYLVAGLSREAVDLSSSSWRDRNLLADAEILSVEAARGGRRFTVAKSSEGWTVDGRPADPAKAADFLSVFRNLSADVLVDRPGAADLKDYGLDKPEATFTVSFSAGAPVVLSFGRGDPRPVKKGGEDTLFLVPAYRASFLDKAPEDLLPKPQ